MARSGISSVSRAWVATSSSTRASSRVDTSTRPSSATARMRSACSEASRYRREWSIAIAAWPAKVSASSCSRAVKGRRARKVSTPMGRSPIRRGTPR